MDVAKRRESNRDRRRPQPKAKTPSAHLNYYFLSRARKTMHTCVIATLVCVCVFNAAAASKFQYTTFSQSAPYMEHALGIVRTHNG